MIHLLPPRALMLALVLTWAAPAGAQESGHGDATGGASWRDGAAAPGRPASWQARSDVAGRDGSVAPQFTPTGPTLTGALPTNDNPSAVPPSPMPLAPSLPDRW